MIYPVCDTIQPSNNWIQKVSPPRNSVTPNISPILFQCMSTSILWWVLLGATFPWWQLVPYSCSRDDPFQIIRYCLSFFYSYNFPLSCLTFCCLVFLVMSRIACAHRVPMNETHNHTCLMEGSLAKWFSHCILDMEAKGRPSDITRWCNFAQSTSNYIRLPNSRKIA